MLMTHEKWAVSAVDRRSNVSEGGCPNENTATCDFVISFIYFRYFIGIKIGDTNLVH